MTLRFQFLNRRSRQKVRNKIQPKVLFDNTCVSEEAADGPDKLGKTTPVEEKDVKTVSTQTPKSLSAEVFF